MTAFDPRPQSSEDDSPVLAKIAPSVVARKEGSLPKILGVVAVAVLGIVVFSSLSQDRQARAQSAPHPRAAAPASALIPTPSPILPPSAPVPSPLPPLLQPPLPDNPDPTGRLKAPAMIIDLVTDPGGGQSLAVTALGPHPGTAPAPASAADTHLSPDERFAERVAGSSAETTRATRLKDTALIAPQGTVIPAVLETAINLDLPGFARAVVSRDVRGFDGTTVVIPRGSRLIGQYRGGVANGQSRAFVVWSRVLTPEGISVDIASPGGDRLGRGGLEGETNTHFFRRFGSSILLSVLSSGLDALASNGKGNQSIVIGSPQQATNIASIALQKEIDIPNTITVAQGTPIRVFVARDLDFSGVVQRAQ